MRNARAPREEDEEVEGAGGITGLVKSVSDMGRKQLGRGLAAWTMAKPYVWWASMTMVFAVAPVVFEAQREGEVIKQDQILIKYLREEGYSSQQIASMGYSDAVAPSVLASQ